MAKATRVHSTPPTNTPIDTHRRHFLAVAAGASVVSVGALTAAAMPAIALGAEPAPDPIYVAIGKHKAAVVVWDAAVDVWAKFPDGPEWRIERERIHDAWCDARNALDDVAIDLINTAPTTLAGIARALNYIRDTIEHAARELDRAGKAVRS